MKILDKIEQWTQRYILNTDFYIVDTERSKDGTKIKIFVDSDKGITVKECVQINKHIRDELMMEGDETNCAFEISSPGLDRPLKLHRQYVKNVGRTVRVVLKGGKTIDGKLTEVKENEIVVEEKIKPKGKKATVKTHTVSFPDIAQTKILVSMSGA